ncbi:hypothetical protein [Candidatus Nitrotoga sp. M5]|nr:hypothetical protein [Candidatus Nitrotoga sp. M5]CAH1386229.1 hypothetical protein NTGM5_240007 [Candidatus Nitrotoga sp. M5]
MEIIEVNHTTKKYKTGHNDVNKCQTLKFLAKESKSKFVTIKLEMTLHV